MTQTGSRVSESGASNESIPNTSSPNEVEVDVDTSKERKAMEPRANCWKHFDKFTDESGASKAKCKYCAKPYAASTSSNGTSSMNTHMRTCPKFPRDTIDKGQNLINFLPSSTGAKKGVISTWKFDQAQSRRSLAKMIIVDELPFSFVEKEGFKNFMRVTVPQFHIPSRRTVTRDCYELYLEEKQLLKKVFKEARPRVCLTTDTWTSIQKINYIHKGVDMAACITNCLLEWGLDNVFTITVDNASSNDVTVKEMFKQLSNWGTNIMNGDHLHVRCMAHILNLIVQDGLKEIDVPTRWNSTYSMLDIAQHFELAFERYSFYDIEYLNHLRTFGSDSSEDKDETSVKDGTSVDILTSVDWKNVRSMVKFLETFYVLTLKVSGSNYITSNTHSVEIAELNLILKEMMANEDGNLKEMAESMNEKFKKYWGEPHKMNKMIFISSIMDPRNKLDYVPFAIVDMFEKEIGDKLCSKVEKYMTKLFEYYVKKSSKSSLHVPSSPTSSNNSSSISSVSGCGNFVNRGRMRTKQQFEKHKEVSGSSGSKSELERYLAEDIEPDSDDFDILKWWKVNEPRFPILAEMVRDVLAIPILSVASECAFSTGGRVLDPFRSSLTPKLVQSLICVQDWLRSESFPINIEEDLEYLEQLELVMRGNGLLMLLPAGLLGQELSMMFLNTFMH
ncbi:hypothetical protein KY290_033621 [Solanum tuberosum]|uniref:BED-type domain-containing protein n=1 Tax=Solanum tuberosum TaxID=4113 RepID=A0ABQ7U1D5_SOLTU|nr:hypothetical protein KY289_032988 [Solanum tuberosum]KAH0740578.1 hypothetical protein KY290_033621 [Solanum tuberosum]